MKLFAIVASLVLIGCASVEYRRSTARDTEAAYRAYLAEHPEGERAAEARERLRALAFQRAARGDDVAAYNRFLAEFPEGDFADEARERRAEARLRRAISEGGTGPLERLIESDPGTPAAERARARLEQLRAAEAVESDEPARLRAFLLAFPDSEDRERIERRLDDLEFDRAVESGEVSPLRRYLEEHPHGVHRAEARDRIEALEADLVVATGRPGEMERYLRRHPGSPSEARVRRALARALIERAEVLLDERMVRRALALEPGPELADRAAALLEEWSRGGSRLERVRRLVADLAGPLEVREVGALEDALTTGDPLDGWNAVREVALSRDPATLDLAVRAAGSGDPLLLFFARAALAARAGEADGRARSLLERWRERLRQRLSNPEDQLRLGVVSEALGDLEAARLAYRDATEHRATAVAAAAHWAMLAAADASPSERGEAASALAEVGRTRTEELLDLIPAEIDTDTLGAALRVLRGLEALGHLVEIASDRLAPVAAGEVEIPAPEARDDLVRLARALSAASRRLVAQLRLHDTTIRPFGSEDPLTQVAVERRERRLAAARRLGELRAARAVPALAEAASDQGEVGRAALGALARIRTDEARATLLALSRDPRLARVHRRALVSALRGAARTAPPGARDELLGAAEALDHSVEGPEQPPPQKT